MTDSANHNNVALDIKQDSTIALHTSPTRMSLVFADAFYFVARLNRHDQHHERALAGSGWKTKPARAARKNSYGLQCKEVGRKHLRVYCPARLFGEQAVFANSLSLRFLRSFAVINSEAQPLRIFTAGRTRARRFTSAATRLMESELASVNGGTFIAS